MFSQNKKSFTLIEMLIVVVIIGILAAALIPRLQGAQGRARDVRRKADLRQIANALEIYLQDFNIYPQAKNNLRTVNYTEHGYVFSWNNTQPWIDGLSGILSSVPTDPINIATANIYGDRDKGPRYQGNFTYSYGAIQSQYSAYKKNRYHLRAQLENKNDPDRNQIKRYQLIIVDPNTIYTHDMMNTSTNYSYFLYSPNSDQALNP